MLRFRLTPPSFQNARLGGDDDDLKITFSAALKRALLTIKVEKPLVIDKKSIARGIPAAQFEHTRIIRAKDSIKNNLGIKSKITPAQMLVALNAESLTESEVSKEDELKFVQALPEILVSARPGGSEKYSWEMEPTISPVLRGQPWDPVISPRMRVILPESSKIEPAIKLEVRCALEDIFISDIRPKDAEIFNRMSMRANGETSDAVAVQFLKKMLVNAELRPGELDNRFSGILLADILALAQ